MPNPILDGRPAQRKPGEVRRPSPAADKPDRLALPHKLGFALIAAACVLAYALLAASIVWVLLSAILWWAS